MSRAFPCAASSHRSATRPFLPSQLTPSSLPSTCRGQTKDRASDVPIARRIAVDRRLLLDARQAQTQGPRRWRMASPPLARAVEAASQAVASHARTAIPQRLTPSPLFCRVSKGRTLQTKVPDVAVVNVRLEALCRSGVSAGCPVCSGLQTGSCSGPPPAGSAFGLWGKPYLNPWGPFCEVEYYRYALRRALTPPCGVPVVVSVHPPLSSPPAWSHAFTRRFRGGQVLSLWRRPGWSMRSNDRTL
jgi:hypothetical protein